jgi:ABC-type phosphate transport system substrate-binding protein
MSIYERARRLALASLCCCGLMVVSGAALVPSFASAANPCDPTTGSGSSLQSAAQLKLTAAFEVWQGNLCEGSKSIVYTATGSGQGLEEFGMFNGKVLLPGKSGNGKKLDGFVGTDEPPSEEKIKSGKEASGTNPITVPVLSAPITVIFHLPTECKITVATWKVPNQELDLLFRHQQTWTQFAAQIGATATGAGCSAKPIVEVRSDNSGTSFAFKQYMSQIKQSVWTEFVNNEPTWPKETQAKTFHTETQQKPVIIENHGSGGEAQAVVLTPNSIGYVNAADAVGNGIKAWHNNQDKVFWGQVQSNGIADQEIEEVETAEPLKTPNQIKTVGNCPPGTYTFSQLKLERQAKASPPEWGGVELANTKTPGFYPLCTFTYDVAWENYTAAKLEAAGAYAGFGKQVGNTTKEYLKFLLKEGQKDIGNGLPEFYSPLPGNIQKVALLAVEKEVDNV